MSELERAAEAGLDAIKDALKEEDLRFAQGIVIFWVQGERQGNAIGATEGFEDVEGMLTLLLNYAAHIAERADIPFVVMPPGDVGMEPN